MVGGGGGKHCNICKPSQILQRRLGKGGGLQCHDSSQSRGGEDRLRVGLTGTVCFDVAEFPEEESDGCCNDRTDERRPVFRP